MKKVLLLILFVVGTINVFAAESIDIDGVIYSINGGNASITSSSCYDGDLVIPAEITDSNGTSYPVTSIGTSAFSECTKLTSVVIPESVTSIGMSAFYKCTKLTSVVIPESVTSIGISAFSGCTELTSVVISGCVELKSSAFSGCTALTSVYFLVSEAPTMTGSNTVTNIFSDVPGNCCFYVPAGSKSYYSSFSNAQFNVVEFSYDENYAYYLYDENEEKTATIFYTSLNNQTTKITIPESFNINETEYTVTAIASGVFSGFESLTKIIITSENVITIAEDSFEKVEGAMLYVPEELVEEYKKSEWGNYFEIAVYNDDVDLEEDQEDQESPDLEDDPNIFTLDGIKYEIIDDDLVQVIQVIGLTDEKVEFVTTVEYDGFTYDVEQILTEPFAQYTDIEAVTKFVDPEKIKIVGNEIELKAGTLTVLDGCVEMYKKSDWTKIFTISGNKYLEQDGVFFVYKSSSQNLKNSAASKKITLEVDQIDPSATSLIIPEYIFIDGDDNGYYNVTSISSSLSFEDCSLQILTIEADIPASEAEALKNLPEYCVLIVKDELKSGYEELLSSTSIEIMTKSGLSTLNKNINVERHEVGRYNLIGQQISEPQRGINIIKYSDGTVEKVVVK